MAENRVYAVKIREATRKKYNLFNVYKNVSIN